jgi:hypothetical protein
MKYAALEQASGLALQYDALAFQAISRVCDRFLPWSNSSLRPSAIQIALNDIFINRRQMVMELGSGLSTVFLAAMIVRHGGRLTTVDHEPSWIEKVRSWLTPEERAVTTFVHAPLVSREFNGETTTWYDSSALRAHLPAPQTVDLLLVDGPPAYERSNCLNRGPALEILGPYLAMSATLLLDDINRSGERHIAGYWSKQLGIEYRDLTVEAGVALWMLGSGCNIAQ